MNELGAMYYTALDIISAGLDMEVVDVHNQMVIEELNQYSGGEHYDTFETDYKLH